MTDIHRPMQHLTAFSARYPRFWKQYRLFLDGKGHDLPDWPEWCYCPIAAAYAIVSGGGNNRCTIEQSIDIGRMAALAAWRATKGIYRFDEDLLQSLLETPITGDLPCEILYRLPEWCVYIELPEGQRQIDDSEIFGFFAHLEWDSNDGRTELRLLLDVDSGLTPIPLHLIGGTLEQSIAAFQDEAIFQQALSTPMSSEQLQELRTSMEEIRAPLQKILAPLVSVLLYLCTENADLSPRDPSPVPKRRRPNRTHAADSVTTWETGMRIGAALRRAKSSTMERETGDGHHASPRPHVRRAHWHTYWKGQRDSQTAFLRWLSPMLIGAEDELVPTVRPIKKEEDNP